MHHQRLTPGGGRQQRDWAAYCQADHAVGMANGTDALELSLMALGIGPGDEVVLPANTFIATAAAVVRVGAVPRFADVSDDMHSNATTFATLSSSG